jgi:antirestriction protein ArdC
LNKKHDANVQFATLIHELGHLFLGHLGEDKFLKISARNKIHEVKEIEAESVCYIVCNRNGVKPDSESYLSNFVTHSTSTEFIDLYELLKVAGNIEAMLGLSIKTSFKNSLQYELIQ